MLKIGDIVKSLINGQIGVVIDIDTDRDYANHIWATTRNAKYKVGSFVVVEYNCDTYKDWDYINELDCVKI